MKKNHIYLFGLTIIASALFSSCEIVKDLVDIEFDTGYKEIHITINPSSAGPYLFSQEYIKSDIEQEIEDNGGDISNLKEVHVNDISLKVVSGEPDLSAFDFVEVHVSTPGQGDVLIGSAYNIIADQIAVQLDATEDDLKNILEEEEYLLEVSGALDKEIAQTTELVLKINYSVVVGP
jgi:hypothetical protein